MKKYLFSLCSLFVGIAFITSCGGDDFRVNVGDNESTQEVSDDESVQEVSELERSYFSIENAIYTEGAFPSPTTNENIQGLSINTNALTGGMNFVTIVSDKIYKKFFIGVKGVPGYWVYDPNTSHTRTTDNRGYNTYSIPVMYSTEYDSNITMLISGEDEHGDVTEPYEAEINYVDSESGDLNINLTFSNAKDVDLHLYTPSGEHIFYGERGGTVETTDGRTIIYGLDHDSNAGCSIDNLNNENIFIPAEKIESGTYRVVVDMYSNCFPDIATSWSVVVRYKGNITPTVTGVNPATGVYPIGAGDGDMTTVMTFTIEDASTRVTNSLKIKSETFKPTPLSDIDEMKLEEVKFRLENK